jgi:hypothetical protein
MGLGLGKVDARGFCPAVGTITKTGVAPWRSAKSAIFHKVFPMRIDPAFQQGYTFGFTRLERFLSMDSKVAAYA